MFRTRKNHPIQKLWKAFAMVGIVPLLIMLSYAISSYSARQKIATVHPDLKFVTSSAYWAKLPNQDASHLGWLFKYALPDADSRYHGVEVYITIWGQVAATNPPTFTPSKELNNKKAPVKNRRFEG